jgi:hypothetical protein
MTKLLGCALLFAVLATLHIASQPEPSVQDAGCTFGWEASQTSFTPPLRCPHFSLGLASLRALLF